MEAEKHRSNKRVYQEVSNSENILPKLAEMSNKVFSSSKKRDYITKNNFNIFPMDIGKLQTLINFISFSNSEKFA